jgi:cytochrome oxidase Cu insertion factor (SCO1/SenC/PrrC family)
VTRRSIWVLLAALVIGGGVGVASGRDKPLAAGDRAPDFVLEDQEGKPFKLSDALARRNLVVVAFYLKADSPG